MLYFLAQNSLEQRGFTKRYRHPSFLYSQHFHSDPFSVKFHGGDKVIMLESGVCHVSFIQFKSEAPEDRCKACV